MFRKWIPLVCLLISPFLWAGEKMEFRLSDLSGGMDSFHDANKIPNNTAVLSQNFFTDDAAMLVERDGTAKRDTTVLGGGLAVTGSWRFLDNSGNEWYISFSSRTFYKNTIGNAPASFGPNITVAQVPDCTPNLGKFWCVNGTDDMWWFDGTSTGSVSAAPKGKLIESYRNRVVIGYITGALSTVRFSESADGTNWTLGTAATDPYSIQIGGANDGDYIRCMHGVYRDHFIVGRKYDLWAHSGFSLHDITTRNLSSEVGCIADETMKEKDNALLFMSARGIESLEGMTVTPISEPVRDILDSVVGNIVEEKRVTHTTQADFQGGSESPSDFEDTTTVVGALSNKTTSWVETTSTHWNAGSFTDANNTDPNAFVDSTTLATEIKTIYPDTFDSYRDGTAWYTLTVAPTVDSGVLEFVNAGEIIRSSPSVSQVTPGTTIYFDFNKLNQNDATCSYRFGIRLSTRPDLTSLYAVGTPDAGGCLYEFRVEDDPSAGEINALAPSGSHCPADSDFALSDVGDPFTWTLWLDDNNYTMTTTGANNSTSGSGAHTAYGGGDGLYVYMGISLADGDCAAGDADPGVDFFGIAPMDFTWTSQALNTGFSEPEWDVLHATITDASGALSFTTQASADGSSWDSAVSVTNESAPTSDSKQYIRLNVVFNHTDYDGVASSFEQYGLSAYSTGTFTSSVMSIGNSITSWAPIGINNSITGSGVISYQFNASTEAALADFGNNWETRTAGQTPTLSTAPYAAFRAIFNPTSSTDSLRLDDFTVSWSEGDAQPIAAIVHDRRYWLAYTTNTAAGSYNNAVLVYQRNGTWTLLRGINAVSFAIWRDSLYFGNSIKNGYVYKFGDGNNDDGLGISSTLKTKRYDFDKFLNEKSFNVLYLNYNGDTSNSGSFTVSYDLDNSGTDISLGTMQMNEVSPPSIKKMPFPLTDVVEGREIQYTITKTGQGDRLKLYDFVTQFEMKEAR